ncbi:hypothetical protein KW791_03425, partial [Candidatus Parcubacteria bacterium]|nr:hypothetical protein [Candidatus Parcubacteria bacterium]
GSVSAAFEIGTYASIGGNVLARGTGSSSFAGSINISKGLTANSIQGAGLTDCSNNLTKKLLYSQGQFTCGDDQTSAGGTLASQTGIAAGQITFFQSSTIASGSAQLTWDSTNKRFGINAGGTTDTTFEIGGTASISGLARFGGSASVSNGFEASGYASASAYFGSAFTGISNCNTESDTLLWNSSTGKFSCGADATGSGSAFLGIGISNNGSTFAHITSLSFEPNMFALTNTASLSLISLNWTSGPASRSATQAITGAWTFSNFTTFTGPASMSNALEITRNGTTGNQLTLTDSSVGSKYQSFGLAVNDGDFQIRKLGSPSYSAFSDQIIPFSIASRSHAITLGTAASPSFKGNLDTSGTARRVRVSGRYAYLADDTGGIKIFDISNPASPSLKGSYNTVANDIQVAGRYAYVAGGGAVTTILDVSNPSFPTLVETLTTSSASGLYVSGKYLYLADGSSGGLRIIDISNPFVPTVVGTYNTPGSAGKVYVVGKYAYVSEGGDGIAIIDISNPSKPFMVSGGSALGTNTFDVYVSGRYAYTADGGSGLRIIDVSNPLLPSLISTFDTPGIAQAITVSGKYAYVADDTSGVKIIDISNPYSPFLAGSYDTAGTARGVTVSGRYLYVGDGGSGLTILDIGGVETHALYAGSMEAGNITVNENMDIGNNLFVQGGLNVGVGGILSNGPLAITASFSSNTASVSAANLFSINHTKGFMSGDAIRVDMAASTSATFFTGNFLKFTSAGSTVFTVTAAGAASVSTGFELSSGYASVSIGSGKQFVIRPVGVLTNDLVNISSNSFVTIANGVNSLQLDYGASQSVNNFGAAERIKFRNMATSGGLVGTTAGLRIIATGTGGSVNSQTIGIQIDPLIASSSVGMDLGISIRGGWDSSLNISSTTQAGSIASISATALTTGNIFNVRSSTITSGNMFNVIATTSTFTGNIFKADAKNLGTGGSILRFTVPSSASGTNRKILLVTDNTGAVIASWNNGGRLAIKANLKSRGINSACTGVNTGGSGCLDYAETYPTKDHTLQAADLVTTDPLNPNNVAKTIAGSDILGVVSTNAAALINGSALLAGADTMDSSNMPEGNLPIALAGRVPLKVSTENGSIEIGDYLTTSSIPGVAMKATKAGNVIGPALNNYDGTEIGQVMTFVNVGYYNGEDLESVAGVFDPSSDTGFENALLHKFIQDPTPIEMSEILADRIAAAVEIISPKIFANSLVINKIGTDQDAISILSDAIFFGRPYFNADTAGFAMVKEGDRNVDVEFTQEYLEQPIVNATISVEEDDSISEETLFNNNIQFIVTKKSVKGFTIKLNKDAPGDIRFSWIALAVKNAKVFNSIEVSSTPPPEPPSSGGSSSGNSLEQSSEATPEPSPESLASPEPTVEAPPSEPIPEVSAPNPDDSSSATTVSEPVSGGGDSVPTEPPQ